MKSGGMDLADQGVAAVRPELNKVRLASNAAKPGCKQCGLSKSLYSIS